MDTVGAFLGPLIAISLMLLTANNFTFVFWAAVIPAFVSLAVIIFAVADPVRPRDLREVKFPLHRSEISRLPSAYWFVTAVAAMFTLARFSEAFLVLKAQATGLPVALIPAVLVLMNVVYALASLPAGIIADRPGGRGRVLILGLLLLIGADFVLALGPGLATTALGVALWGLHMGLTQGLLAAMIADRAPQELRGTAYGMFNLITSVALLLASIIAGELWDRFGPSTTFLCGAAFAAAALAGWSMVRNFARPAPASDA
jgi:MFS family permease